MKVVWTETAASRLESIEAWIARENPERAVAFVDDLITAAARLAEFPESGHVLPERPGGPYRHVVHRRYRIVYRLGGDDVFVLTVFDGARMLRNDELMG